MSSVGSASHKAYVYTVTPDGNIEPKTDCYVITRRDFVQSPAARDPDRKGNLVLLEVHASLASAVSAARAHLRAKARDSRVDKPEVQETKDDKGMFKAYCQMGLGTWDLCIISIRKMDLKDGTSAVDELTSRPSSRGTNYTR